MPPGFKTLGKYIMESSTVHNSNARRSPVLSDTTCPRPNNSHADKRRATADMASADKEASQNQSEIPNRQHWNNDRKKQRS